MFRPAENVLLIYDVATKQLLRRVIPDYQHQEDDPSFFDPARGEAMIKVSFELHRSWRERGQHFAQQHVIAHAP
jgi:hypothetical protein